MSGSTEQEQAIVGGSSGLVEHDFTMGERDARGDRLQLGSAIEAGLAHSGLGPTPGEAGKMAQAARVRPSTTLRISAIGKPQPRSDLGPKLRGHSVSATTSDIMQSIT